MQIYKRKGSNFWSYSFSVRGARIRRSTRTNNKAKASEIAAKHYNDILKRNSGDKPEITLDKAFARYWLSHASKLSSARVLAVQTKITLGYFGKDILLSEVSQSVFSDFVNYLQNRTIAGKKVKYISKATINRYIANFRQMLNMARDEWGYNTPQIMFSKFTKAEQAVRVRWITHEQAKALIKNAAPHIKLFICIALFTGARKENILSLTWKQVDFKGKTVSFVVKGGKAHVVPLVKPLADMLCSIDKTGEYVVLYKGGRVLDVKKGFASACKRAGIKDFRIHDLRHTCASWLVQNNTPIEVVQKILGHSRINVTLKYAHHNQEVMAKNLEKLASEWM